MKFKSCFLPLFYLVFSLSTNYLEGQGRPRDSKQYNQQTNQPKSIKPALKMSENWADSILKTLNFKQLVGQTLMVPAWSKTNTIDPIVLSAIEKQEVGGIIFYFCYFYIVILFFKVILYLVKKLFYLLPDLAGYSKFNINAKEFY